MQIASGLDLKSQRFKHLRSEYGSVISTPKLLRNDCGSCDVELDSLKATFLSCYLEIDFPKSDMPDL